METEHQGYWNGKSVKYQVVNVQVTNKLGRVKSWAKPFIGQTRQAVKIIVERHVPFYLDNVDGTSLAKVQGKGDKVKVYRALGDPKEIKVLEIPHIMYRMNNVSIKHLNMEKSSITLLMDNPVLAPIMYLVSFVILRCFSFC